MPYEFKFPDVGEGIHEGQIVKWHVNEGDKVKADQPLGEVETDKAVVEMPSPKTGTILKLHVAAGSTIHVGEVMVTILLEEESHEDGQKHLEEKAKAQENVPYTGSVVGFVEEAKGVSPILSAKSEQSATKTLQATPAVRSLAKQLNVDLNSIKGTGPDGRITIQDVQKAGGARYDDSSQESQSAGIKVTRKYDFYGYIDHVQLKGVKKISANRMTESMFTAPQLTNMNEADVTNLVAMREKEKIAAEKEGIKLTMLAYIVKVASKCLEEHPYLNASMEGEVIILKKYYNIGVAVDTEEGLYVPVVKGAAAKDVKTIAKDIEKLANAVKTKKINLMDLKGSSFTISNLGAIGVEFFTPIINYPESAILGVGRTMEKPVVRNGKIEIRKILPLSLTYDHRIVDGGQAARFMIDLIGKLELCEF